MIYHTFLKTPVGKILITGTRYGLTNVIFIKNEGIKNDLSIGEENKTFFKTAEKQIKEYFSGERREFDLKTSLNGTPFQLSAWKALTEIPYGETISYGKQAEIIGNKKACRAIGSANGRNPLPIIIPCHRVIAKNGIGGFGGGVEIKKFLLDLEKKFA